jgi:hypothetical protein
MFMGQGIEMNDEPPKNTGRKFRPLDFLVILFCLSGAAYSFNQFRINISKNENPLGTIIISNNVVQRHMAKRALWDRLPVDSPVYSGDQIRTADLSNATLYIERNSIDLDEKTLIRIRSSPKDEDAIIIYLDEGNLVLNTGIGSGKIILNLMGRQVEAGPGTVLNASMGKEGSVVRVSEGTATLTGEKGAKREIASGTMIALDTNGAERTVKAAAVLQPRPDARYLKDSSEPLFVNFEWNRLNVDPGEALCLELAEDRNFKRIIRVIENLDTATGTALNAGFWYWRLSLMQRGTSVQSDLGAWLPPAADVILATGRLSVIDASGPALLSPVTDSLIRYQNNKLPQLRFQWSETAEASSYILEISETPDFINPRIRTQTASVFLFDSSMGPGTWYWRVLPVFPPVYEGHAAFSPASFFRIEQGTAGDSALVLPVPPLPAPGNRLPPTGHRIGVEQLKESNRIVFSWSAVPGANAYIFTLFQDTDSGRRQIVRVPPGNRRNWTMENLAALGSGAFIWQVEAVKMDSTDTIEQKGRIAENSFVINIPLPGQVEMEDPGTLYGH